jgi:hypothetical protein
MAGDQRQLGMLQLSIDDMKVRSADGASFDSDEHFTSSRRRVRQFCFFQRAAGFD